MPPITWFIEFLRKLLLVTNKPSITWLFEKTLSYISPFINKHPISFKFFEKITPKFSKWFNAKPKIFLWNNKYNLQEWFSLFDILQLIWLQSLDVNCENDWKGKNSLSSHYSRDTLYHYQNRKKIIELNWSGIFKKQIICNLLYRAN